MNRIGRIGRGLFGAAVFCALGAGATQAFAVPPTEPAARSCYPMQCRQGCSEVGYRTGQCINGYCECLY